MATNLKRAQQLLRSMTPSKIYRQADLQKEWPNASHDLKSLLDQGYIEKISPGLYFKPRKSKYGSVSPSDKELVRSFLRDDDFLIFDTNLYTSLVGGLTQLAMGQKVLNKRRHGIFELAGFPFDFRVRRAFPKKLTKEFLLVDLLDNLSFAEDGESIQVKVKKRLNEYNPESLLETAKKYGNRSTVKLLRDSLLVNG